MDVIGTTIPISDDFPDRLAEQDGRDHNTLDVIAGVKNRSREGELFGTALQMWALREQIAVVEIDPDRWEELSEEHRRALIDHELVHLRLGAKGRLTMRGHDVEEFSEILERHGLWRKDLEQFVGTALRFPRSQVTFAFAEGDESEEAA